MTLRPIHPVSDTPDTQMTTPTPVVPAQNVPVAGVFPRLPAVQLTPGSLITIVVGGTAVVVTVGAVLVSLLLAVAITGLSVAVVAVVLRSLLNHHNNQH